MPVRDVPQAEDDEAEVGAVLPVAPRCPTGRATDAVPRDPEAATPEEAYVRDPQRRAPRVELLLEPREEVLEDLDVLRSAHVLVLDQRVQVRVGRAHRLRLLDDLSDPDVSAAVEVVPRRRQQLVQGLHPRRPSFVPGHPELPYRELVVTVQCHVRDVGDK